MTQILVGAGVSVTERTAPTALMKVVRTADGGLGIVNADPYEDFVGITEISELLELSRQRVSQLAQHESFPSPVVRTKAGAFWLKSHIIDWAKSRAWRVAKYSADRRHDDSVESTDGLELTESAP